MRTRYIAGVLALAVLVAACVTTNATRLSTTIRPPVPADGVTIYRGASQVPGKYEEVALLTSSGDHSLTSEAQMYESMRKKAGAMGANGVILDTVAEPGTGAKVANAILGTAADREGKAVAIYVFSSEAAK